MDRKENRLTQRSMMLIAVIVAFTIGGCKKSDGPKSEDKKDGLKLTVEQIKERVNKLSFVSIFTKTEHQNLADGLDYYEISFKNAATKPYALFIVRADLKKNDLTLRTLTPYDKPDYGLQPVLPMAQLVSSSTEQILAAINGDFYDWSPVSGRTRGPVVKNGVLIKHDFHPPTGEPLGAYNFFGLKKDKTLTMGTSANFFFQRDDFQEVIGGRERVVRAGKFSEHWDKAREPRTLLGFTADNVVYLVVVDGRRDEHSIGFTNDEGGLFMQALGVSELINLDGGGSSTMVIEDADTKSLKIKNRYTDSSPRAVANGLAIIKKSN